MISHFDLNFLFIDFGEIQFSDSCQFCSSQADLNMGSHISCFLTTKHRKSDHPEKAGIAGLGFPCTSATLQIHCREFCHYHNAF